MVRILLFALILHLFVGHLWAQNRALDSLEDEIKQMLKQHRSDTSTVNLLNDVALLARLLKPKQSLLYAQQALLMGQKYSHTMGVANAYINIGAAYKELDSQRQSLDYYQQGLRFSEENKLLSIKAKALNGLGTGYEGLGKNDSALYFLRLASLLAANIGETKLTSTIHSNIGSIFTRQAVYDSAVSNFLIALKAAEKTQDSPLILQLLSNISVVYADYGKYDKALDYTQQALTIAQKLGNPRFLSVIYNNIGKYNTGLQKYDTAVVYLLRSATIKEQLGAKSSLANTYASIGDVYRRLKQSQMALAYIKKGLQIQEEIGKQQPIAETLVSLSKAYLENNNINEAIQSGLRAFYISDTNNFVYEKQIACEALALGYEKAQDFRSALKFERLRMVLKDSVWSLETVNKVAEIQTKYDTEKKDKEILQQSLLISQQSISIQQRNLFVVGMILIVIILGLLLNRYRIKKNAEEQLRLKNQEIAHLAQEKALADERGRIAKDIHDEVGPGMMRIALLAGALEEKIQDGEGGGIADSAQEVIDAMNGIIWMTNPKNDTLDNLAGYIQEKATEWFERIGEGRGMTLNVILPDVIPALPLEGNVRRNLYLCVKEALNNALKHSAANRVELALVLRGNEGFEWRVGDNGQGFEPNSVSRFSNGLANMRSRMEEIGGTCKMESVSGQGTTVRFIVG